MTAVRQLARRHPLATYVVLAYTISWSCWLPLVLRGSIVRQGDGWPTDLLGLMGPAMAAAITLALTGGRPALSDWGRRIVRVRLPRWCYLFVVLTLVLGFGTELIRSGHVLPAGVSAYTGAPDLGLALTFVLALVVNGIGEEAGWRGFLADRLLERHGLLRTASWVALAWAGWHLPLFFVVDSFRGLGFAVIGWMFGLYAGSVVLTWLYAAGGRSIFLVALWHTAFNFTSGTTAMNGVPAAVTSTAVMFVAGVVAVVLVRNGKRQQQSAPETSGSRGHRDREPLPGGRR
jgi:membrane protease YdiL (CAAX protease family)